MKIIQAFDKFLTRLVNAALVTIFCCMMGLAVTQVLLRLLLHTSILWGDIASRHLVLWVGFLGAFLAAKENSHFHIDVLTRFLKSQHQVWLRRTTAIFASVVCFFLGQSSLTFLNLDIHRKAFLDIPLTVVEVIAPIGFYLMMVQFAIRAVGTAAPDSQHSPSNDHNDE